MESLIALSALDLERLLITIESSQQVYQRHQYFLWSQGMLQNFLPHEVLVFGYGEYGSPTFRYDVLGRIQLADDRLPGSDFDNLVGLALDGWQCGGHLPKAFGGDDGAACPVGDLLRKFSLGHALAHGTREFAGETSAFFFFLNMPERAGRRHSYFAEMLMPYLHTTLHRMLMSEKTEPQIQLRLNVRLSTREAQVISLVRDGKTNQEIGKVLELSPLTVKNHVQNILRKLKVANRAQAVAKVLSARLIGDQQGA